MQFYNTKMFYLFGLILLSAGLYLRLHLKNREKMRRLGDAAMVKAMCGSVSYKKRMLTILLKLCVMTLIILALARPKAGLTTETVKTKGSDIIIVFDVSKSMLATDTAPNRFERAKLEIISLIDKLDGDRVGLVLFSGTAFMQMPLTLDYSAAKLFVKNTAIDTLPQPGTAGSAAINICLDVFERESERAKAIVIFTDGEFHDKGLAKSATKAKEAGVIIYSVGFGTAAGGPIPLKKKGGVTDFKKDKHGNVVLSKMNRKKLFEISSITGGEYYNTSSPDIVYNLMESFYRLEKSGLEETRFTQFEEKFELPLFLAGIMLIIEALISDRKKSARTKGTDGNG